MSKPSSKIWLWGVHPVQSALANPKRTLHRLLCTKDFGGVLKGLKPEVIDRKSLDQLLPPGAVHQGVALLTDPLPPVNLESFFKKSPSLLVVLDHVTDPHNVGAIMRSAAAFGADALIMTDRHAPPFSGTLAKSACGGLEHVPLCLVTNMARSLETLKEKGFWCVGFDEHGTQDLNTFERPEKIALILGAEGEGLRRLTKESCDFLLRLPTSPTLAR